VIKVPPQAVLNYYKDRLEIDPETGTLTWQIRPHNQNGELGNLRADGVVGWAASRANTYLRLNVTVEGKQVGRSVHQIAWYLYYGEWPLCIIDHINRDTRDNRKCNLRLVSAQQSSINCKKRTTASSRYKGVSWWKAKNRWKAYISNPAEGVGGAELYLGMFTCEHKAAAAYNCIAREWYGPYAVLNELPPGVAEPERI
jgi:hypothetical protein